MASEYLKWKYRDVKPDQAVELTPRQKRANWWYYHKWYVLLGAGLLAASIYLVARALGFGQVTPDYQVAYVGSTALPEDTAAVLETALADLGSDCDGDGHVVVRVNQYVMGDTSGEGAVYSYASSTRLMADLDSCDSYFFYWRIRQLFRRTTRSCAAWTGVCRRKQITTTKAAACPGRTARHSSSSLWVSTRKKF